ncbi:daunorubicin resistance protein DrrA family ABC transporter ATP-binding protein [Cellulomonas fimi]|uniref:Daunorubicin resistance ABC transporter ATPase subunit n=1 Tax=Cellulomonas fimi (strain ATCC 484 / DSM 20113 / JCM 1341 / CCUG 24087 / LMG 16345 / NBRC 15513 / NCIMB 8980 / NCTC 7547 / NRS-133) TaxID=590998 RepID=F4H0F2_CELFA|nr:daunorubicin resistance protein DrrA family ABC transporter ATP-binding protein [Cellulomonas fimi]AEE47321.1 daunorubicin resistance ABC transporter ATPase subunit [Cellulomonas fimi ATCC 484]NNH05850.1 daunorubicin resistance protein DrrA family ABC transporter ATP-binding protein [Cellulomonas fimi]VEH35915.1 Daunorubicin/doxorubicin resistance ATP-binding protein DrrA [Cellulomonas fimi]
MPSSTRSPARPDLAVRARGLTRRYGDTTVLDGLDLDVEPGTVHALLGPNGAGKTTTVRIVATLLAPHGGTAHVAGFDVVREAGEVRRRVGLVGQHAAVDEILGGRENLVMFGRLSHLGTREARRRADELVERFDLVDAADRPVATYSGGMRRRLDLAAGLVLDPEVLLLDEPTTGLDPGGRREVWQAVRELVRGGTAVLLTTQYLEEVDQLASQVSVLARGRLVARGTPDALKASIGQDRLDVVVRHEADLAAARTALDAVGSDVETELDTRRVTATVADRVAALTHVVRTLDDAGVAVDDVALRRPTLDEAFLHLTAPTAPRPVTEPSEEVSR